MAVVKGGRLFAFGCSLTRYHWPTWADILGTSYYEFQNWGNRGAGNRQIMERVAECLTQNNFTGEDTIIVQWTDHHRFDQHKWDPEMPESWYPGGNIFTDTGADPLKTFVINKMWHEESFMMHTFNYIYATTAMLRNTKARVLMFFGNDLRPELNQPQWNMYKQFMMNNYWIDGDLYNWTVQRHDNRLKFKGAKLGDLSEEPTMDFHPTPIMHYEFLKERVSSKVGLQANKQFADKMQKALENCEHYKDIGQAIIDAGYDTNKNYKRGM